MSHRELARRAKVRQSFISETECGETNPSLESMALIADALGCPVCELLMGDDVNGAVGLSRRDVQRIATAVMESMGRQIR